MNFFYEFSRTENFFQSQKNKYRFILDKNKLFLTNMLINYRKAYYNISKILQSFYAFSVSFSKKKENRLSG